jgi:hypothetical protein
LHAPHHVTTGAADDDPSDGSNIRKDQYRRGINTTWVTSTVPHQRTQLSVFTSEVTRVAREVGTEGKLGGQAQVKGVSGVWKDLTDSVNQMAGNLTAQVRNIAEVTIAEVTVAKGLDRRKYQSRAAIRGIVPEA